TSTPTTQPSTLSLHDALPISFRAGRPLATPVATADARPFAGQARSCGSIGTNTYRIALCHFGNVAAAGVQCGKYFVAIDLRHDRSEEHTSELQSRENLVCRLL